MAVKADWGQTALAVEEEIEHPATKAGPIFDPFDSGRSVLTMLQMIDSNMPVADVGLTTPPEELHRMLAISLKREARLDERGVTCDLKECGEVTCLACPFNRCHDDDHPKQTLCRIGMEQDILGTLLLAQSRGERVGQPGVPGTAAF